MSVGRVVLLAIGFASLQGKICRSEENPPAASRVFSAWERVHSVLDGRRWQFHIWEVPLSQGRGIEELVRATQRTQGRPLESGLQGSDLRRALAEFHRRAVGSTFDWTVEVRRVGGRSLETREPSSKFDGIQFRGPYEHPPIQHLRDQGIDLLYIPMTMRGPSAATLKFGRQPISPIGLAYATSPLGAMAEVSPEWRAATVSTSGDETRLDAVLEPGVTSTVLARPSLGDVPFEIIEHSGGLSAPVTLSCLILYGSYEGLLFPSVCFSKYGGQGAEMIRITETDALRPLSDLDTPLRVQLSNDGGLFDESQATPSYLPMGQYANWPSRLKELVVPWRRNAVSHETQGPGATGLVTLVAGCALAGIGVLWIGVQLLRGRRKGVL